MSWVGEINRQKRHPSEKPFNNISLHIIREIITVFYLILKQVP